MLISINSIYEYRPSELLVAMCPDKRVNSQKKCWQFSNIDFPRGSVNDSQTVDKGPTQTWNGKVKRPTLRIFKKILLRGSPRPDSYREHMPQSHKPTATSKLWQEPNPTGDSRGELNVCSATSSFSRVINGILENLSLHRKPVFFSQFNYPFFSRHFGKQRGVIGIQG